MRAIARDGSAVSLTDSDLEALDGTLQGELLTVGEPGYDEARSIWNGMIDRHPGAIARCVDASDVQEAVKFARKHDLLVAIRGGGHNIAGNAVCEGGLVIDLSPMRTVDVDPEARRATVEPGCTLADFDGAAQAHALATPLGINSTTGVAGLTLGGGFGWLTRKHGLTVDNLVSAEVVTAQGELMRASEEENPNLFWGLRGGGGNFGIVTSFEFQLHPVGPDVHSGLAIYALDDAPRVLRQWRDFMNGAPDELSVWAVLRQAPPLPFLPEEHHGRPVVALAVVYAGDPAEGERAAAPVLEFGEPLGHHLGPQPYAEFQQAFDPLLEPGARNYWKSHDFLEMPDEALDAVVAAAEKIPTFGCEVFVAALGGAMGRVPTDATAYAGRDADYLINLHGRWQEPEQDEECIGWARSGFEALSPHASGSVYVNFLTQDEGDRVQAAYGRNYERLAELKGHYDPTNFFRMNQNVQPKA